MENHFESTLILTVSMVLFYQMAGKLIETHNCSFLHESTVGILAGLLIAFFVNKVHAGAVIQFSEKGFFLFILPPIIFAAGYTLKKKNFIRNISYIFALGIFGTLIAMVTISTILTFCNNYSSGEQLNSGEGNWILPNECLLLAAVLCSTDTVAVLTLVTADKYSTLNSVLFGEGVINDAVAILLFKAIENVMKSGSESGSFGKDQIVKMIFEFMYLSSSSLAMGVFFGLLASWMLKKVDMNDNPVKQCMIIILFAYLAYLVAELTHFSGIITLFSCGITMAHYGYYNISKQA